MKLRAMAGFLGQHKNEMENKQLLGSKGLGREITYINKIGNELIQMGNEHLLERQDEHFVMRQST